MPQNRTLFALVALSCAGMIGGAMYFQHVLGMAPCPLCILQRIAVIAVGTIALMAAIHNPARPGQCLYGGLIALTAAIGAAISARHIWLQHLPEDKVPDCGPGLNYMLEIFPLSETLEMVLKGSGECAEVHWTFLGLTIPGWTLATFVVFIILGMVAIFKPRRDN